jgi:hypothetical protein
VREKSTYVFNYTTPFPSCWPTEQWCWRSGVGAKASGANQNYSATDGTKRCILFKMVTSLYYKSSNNAACTANTPNCYPGVDQESSYKYAPLVAQELNNANLPTVTLNTNTAVMTLSSSSSFYNLYNNKPRSYWGGLCNPYTDGSGIDDPHFVGGDGVRFDFNGQVGKSFALLSDNRVHINMIIGGYMDPRGSSGDAFASAKVLRSWIT